MRALSFAIRKPNSEAAANGPYADIKTKKARVAHPAAPGQSWQEPP